MARQFLADASNHILLGSRSIEKGERAVKELQSQHLSGIVELVQVDVSSEDSVAAAAAKAVESEHGKYVATTSLSIAFLGLLRHH